MLIVGVKNSSEKDYVNLLYPTRRGFLILPGLIAMFWLQCAGAIDAIDGGLAIPKVGDSSLRILSPNVLELILINTKQPYPGRVGIWDWVTDDGVFVPTNFSSIKVIINGQTNNPAVIGFKRRPLYAPLEVYDLRIANYLYLQLSNSMSVGQSVSVINNGTVWPTSMTFTATSDRLRYSPAIHVNQEGYVPAFPKKAIVGYYLGDIGELAIPTNTFLLVNAQNGTTAYQGTLTLRADVGFTYPVLPYQNVQEADFSNFTTPGQYRLMVPGLGASLPFRIDEGVGMAFARTYALGLFHQRCGYNVALPFTRFAHAPDHSAPATIPTNASAPFEFTWTTISNNAIEVNSDNPPQTAPRLTNASAQLFPYIRQGAVDISGGHFEAGNYSRVVWNMAQFIHLLMFSVDSMPGVGALDNLGIPESGDSISDILQEAKWEADALAKMQDTDGGFYYMIYPQQREYEFGVLPEDGDPEVAWPKNTAITASSVAALAQCASSPRFKQAYPQVASNYWFRARLGWTFLTNALAIYTNGAYQRIMHFGDTFTDQDDLAWAACEMFVATGNPQFHAKLQSWFPDPTDISTIHWGWQRMFASYGNAIRSYAAAGKSGRLQTNQFDQTYFGKCLTAITDCGNDKLLWSQEQAYGSSVPEIAKSIKSIGWYFSTEQAFDLVVAQLFNPTTAYVDAILRNLNYEGGCNPVNVTFVTGLGWKRQRQLIDLYGFADVRLLPKTGIPIGSIQEVFYGTWTYQWELPFMCYPRDGDEVSPYAFYDRWGDAWNVSTEASTDNTVRCFAVAAWLAAQTSLASQPWRSTNATITVSTNLLPLGQPLTATLHVADTNLTTARIVWEARDQEPTFGELNFMFTPQLHDGTNWIEAEVQWPDGRRAFASNSVAVFDPNAPPQLSNPRRLAGGFSFHLVGAPFTRYLIQASTNLVSWEAIATNTMSASGMMDISNLQVTGFARRYYRAFKAN
jgi:hypothetical protein